MHVDRKDEISARSMPSEMQEAQVAAREAAFLSVEDVHKSFGPLQVLRGISFNVRRGEVVCMIGPSGSGKSTLLKCINRLETPSAGRIVVDRVDVTAANANLPKVRQEIGMVFQSFNLFPHLSAIDNVIEGLRTVRRVDRKEALARGRALLSLVGLLEKEGEKPARLSGGQKQRVAIARALAMNPKLMLFDEPTSALDPELVNEVLDVMGDLARKGMTMIIVTHEIHFADRVSDRVLMLDSGKIIEEGPPSTVLHRASHPRTRSFLQQLEH
jgi:ABC-type polar amino acid transport system ATPase subunit